MKSVSRSVRLMLAVVLGLAMSLSFTASASAAGQAESPAPEATWTLSDYEQKLCYPAHGPHTSYFVGFLSGYWTTTLLPSVEGLPEGTTYELTSQVPPGDNGDRSVGLVWLILTLPPLEYGDYPATLIVTDGTSTQTMPMLIKSQATWGCDIGLAAIDH